MAKAKRKPPRRKLKPSRKTRASWRGMIQFGLVSISVEAVNAHAVDADHIAFHQLHAECHSRIRYEKTCPTHGPVSNDEIISGYEYAKGKYVEIDPDELDKLRTKKERNLNVDAFIDPQDIDVIHFDGRMYYLVPAGSGDHSAYAVFLESLKRQEAWGVGTIAMSGKQQPVIVRPYHNVLHMALLNYDAEMRPTSAVLGSGFHARAEGKSLRLAEQLVESWFESDFDFSQYKDNYYEKLKQLIETKLQGEVIVEPEAEEEEPEVINLMDALRKSVAQHAPRKPRTRKPARRRKRRAS